MFVDNCSVEKSKKPFSKVSKSLRHNKVSVFGSGGDSDIIRNSL